MLRENNQLVIQEESGVCGGVCVINITQAVLNLLDLDLISEPQEALETLGKDKSAFT